MAGNLFGKMAALQRVTRESRRKDLSRDPAALRLHHRSAKTRDR